MTQEQFSAATGVHLSAIRKYEGRISFPNSESLLGIARTGINIHWLLTGEGDMRAAASGEITPLGTDPKVVRRLKAIADILADLDESKRAAVLKEIFSRVQETKRVADLESLLLQREKPKAKTA